MTKEEFEATTWLLLDAAEIPEIYDHERATGGRIMERVVEALGFGALDLLADQKIGSPLLVSPTGEKYRLKVTMALHLEVEALDQDELQDRAAERLVCPRCWKRDCPALDGDPCPHDPIK